MSPHALLILAVAGQLPQGCPGGACAPPTFAPPSGQLVPITGGGWAERFEDAEGTHYKLNRPQCPPGLSPGPWQIAKDTNNRPSWRKWEAGVERWWYPREWASLSFPDSKSFREFVASRGSAPKGLPAWAEKGVDQPRLEQSPRGWWLGSQPFAAASGPDSPLPSPEYVQKSIARVEATPSRKPEPAPPRRSLLFPAVLVLAAVGFVVYRIREG